MEFDRNNDAGPPPPPPPPPPLSVDESNDMLAAFEQSLRIRPDSISSPRPQSQSILDLENLNIPPPPPPPPLQDDANGDPRERSRTHSEVGPPPPFEPPSLQQDIQLNEFELEPPPPPPSPPEDSPYYTDDEHLDSNYQNTAEGLLKRPAEHSSRNSRKPSTELLEVSGSSIFQVPQATLELNHHMSEVEDAGHMAPPPPPPPPAADDNLPLENELFKDLRRSSSSNESSAVGHSNESGSRGSFTEELDVVGRSISVKPASQSSSQREIPDVDRVKQHDTVSTNTKETSMESTSSQRNRENSTSSRTVHEHSDDTVEDLSQAPQEYNDASSNNTRGTKGDAAEEFPVNTEEESKGIDLTNMPTKRASISFGTSPQMSDGTENKISMNDQAEQHPGNKVDNTLHLENTEERKSSIHRTVSEENASDSSTNIALQHAKVSTDSSNATQLKIDDSPHEPFRKNAESSRSLAIADLPTETQSDFPEKNEIDEEEKKTEINVPDHPVLATHAQQGVFHEEKEQSLTREKNSLTNQTGAPPPNTAKESKDAVLDNGSSNAKSGVGLSEKAEPISPAPDIKGKFARAVSVQERIKSFSRYARKNSAQTIRKQRSESLAQGIPRERPKAEQSKGTLKGIAERTTIKVDKADVKVEPGVINRTRSLSNSKQQNNRMEELAVQKRELSLELSSIRSRSAQLRRKVLQNLKQEKQEEERQYNSLTRRMNKIRSKGSRMHNTLCEFLKSDVTIITKRLEAAERYQMLLEENKSATSSRLNHLKHLRKLNGEQTWEFLDFGSRIQQLVQNSSQLELLEEGVLYQILAQLSLIHKALGADMIEKQTMIAALNSCESNIGDLLSGNSSSFARNSSLENFEPFGLYVLRLREHFDFGEGGAQSRTLACQYMVDDFTKQLQEYRTKREEKNNFGQLEEQLRKMEQSELKERTIKKLNHAENVDKVRREVVSTCENKITQETEELLQKQCSAYSALQGAQQKRIVELGEALARSFTDRCRQACREIDQKSNKLSRRLEHAKMELSQVKGGRKDITMKRDALSVSARKLEESRSNRKQCAQQQLAELLDMLETLKESHGSDMTGLPRNDDFGSFWEVAQQLPATEKVNKMTRQQLQGYRSGCELANMIHTLIDAKKDLSLCRRFVENPKEVMKTRREELSRLGDAFGSRLVTYLRSFKRGSGNSRVRSRKHATRVSIEAVVHNVKAHLRQHTRKIARVESDLCRKVQNWEESFGRPFVYGGQVFNEMGFVNSISTY